MAQESHRPASAAGTVRAFRRDIADFPSRAYLCPDPEKVAQWKKTLDALGEGSKVGISWIGGLQRTGRSRRSLTLEQLKGVLSPSVQWIALQHQDVGAEIA